MCTRRHVRRLARYALHAHPHITLYLEFPGVFGYAAVGAYTLVTAWRYHAGPLLLTRMAANV